jgi:two-component system, OmpR family, response regulator VicR
VEVSRVSLLAAGPAASDGIAWLPDRRGLLQGAWLQREPILMSDRRPQRKEPIHVLVIEDDVAIAEMYRVQLEYDGYRVTIANTGEHGFASMAAARPDIVLLDLLLPDRSGLEIMHDIKARFANHPPVVILSNYGEPTMIDRGFSLGALEYLVKSRVTPAVVSRSIPGWIEQADRGRSETDS